MNVTIEMLAYRQILVNDRTDQLLATDYDPYTVANMIEAMHNLDEEDYFALSCVAGALANVPDNQFAQNNLAHIFMRLMNDYWEPLARAQAEGEIPSAAELCNDIEAERARDSEFDRGE